MTWDYAIQFVEIAAPLMLFFASGLLCGFVLGCEEAQKRTDLRWQ